MDQIRQLFAGLLVVATFSVSAELIDHGNGLVSDTTLNITWMKDANMIKTMCDANDPLWESWPEPNPSVANNFGRSKENICINDDGRLNWHEAESWINHLNINQYLGHTGWRLPITPQPDASCLLTNEDGQSLGPRCEGSELGHLFNSTLKNHNGIDHLCEPDCLINTGPFINFQSSWYMSGTVYAPDQSQVWTFLTSVGFQLPNTRDSVFGYHVWPVRSNKPAAIEPRTVPVFSMWGLCLLGLLLAWITGHRFASATKY